MKKILVVLLVLAVAGGVFAQGGSWTLSGAAQIGTMFNLNPDLGDYVGSAGGSYKPWTSINGEFGATYEWDEGLKAGLSFNTTDWLFANVEGAGDRYRFQAKAALIALLGGIALDSATFKANGDIDTSTHYYLRGGLVDRLWGEYTMLNGMVTLEAAYNSRQTDYWKGATAGHDAFRIDGGDVGTYKYDAAKTTPVPGGDGFTYVDHKNYFLANFGFSDFSFGVQIPNTFIITGKEGFHNDNDANNKIALTAGAANTGWGVGSYGTGHIDFVEDALKRTIIGFKFDSPVIGVAAQFNLYNFGAYLGAKIGIGDSVTAEISFQGIFNPETNNDTTTAVAGIGFGYDAGFLNAKINAGVFYDANLEGLVIGVKPTFTFNILPDYLAFNLEAGFWFGQDDFDWAFMPSFWWNFKGTGAGAGYYSGKVDTGIIIRYTMWKDTFNCMDVVFRWNF